MKIHELPGDPGRTQKRKRVGRGHGSGLGKTSGKGHKGQKARTGGVKGGAFEGGQMPLVRRIPKFGFHNHFRVEYEVVNLAGLERVFEAGAVVDVEALKNARLVRTNKPVKVLAQGIITKALTIKVHKASEAAVKKIVEAGGSFEAIGG
jgi:large subunit ribosomal protein L15